MNVGDKIVPRHDGEDRSLLPREYQSIWEAEQRVSSAPLIIEHKVIYAIRKIHSEKVAEVDFIGIRGMVGVRTLSTVQPPDACIVNLDEWRLEG